MGKYKSIEDIRSKRDEIRDKIKSIDFKTFKGQTFESDFDKPIQKLDQ